MRFRQHQDAAQAASRRLLGLFALVLLVLVVAVNAVLALVYRITLPWTEGFPNYFFETNTALVLLFVLGGCWFEMVRLREGGRHVARLAGGTPIDAPEGSPRDLYEKRLRNVVDEVAIAAGLSSPPVYVLRREDAINAFAAGWDTDDVVVAVTRGALERLTRDELQGVVAHEFSHILHGDLRLNMRLIGLVWGLQMVYNFGHTLAEPDEHGRRGAGVLFGLGLMAVGSLGWLAGRLLKAAVSRQREFLADASAVKFTRSIDGIGGALRKIADQSWRGQDHLHGSQAEALSHLFFVSHLRWATLATHPPLGERIRRIYGFEVVPLAAKVLPPQDDDEPATLPFTDMPMTPLAPVDPLAETAPGDLGPATGAQPVSVLHAPAAGRPSLLDPLQDRRLDSPLQQERDALERIRRWHGPGERRTAVLALLLTPGSEKELLAWRRETAAFPRADAVLGDLAALTPAARLPVLEVLLRRCARGPMAERRELVQAARRVMGADGQVRPVDRLKWLAMRHLLAGPCPPAPVPAADNDMAHLSEEVAAVTAFLARIVGADDAAAAAGVGESVWYRAVVRVALADGAMPAWRSPDAHTLAQAWAGLQRLNAMQRPVLLRAWVDAAVQLSPGQRLAGDAADALRLSALLLDTPSPRALADQYIEIQEDEKEKAR